MTTIWQGLAVLALLSVPAGVGAQAENELDRFMARVLEQQGRNAAPRLQYVMDERVESRITGPDGELLVRGEYTWYARDGVFVRSPIRVDGVTIGAAERRAYETEWLEREQRRARPSLAGEGDAGESASAIDALMLHWMFAGLTEETAQAASDWGDDERDPRFLTDVLAFMVVLFESGTWYLVGRETLDGDDVLRIEYYPERLAADSGDAEPGFDAEIDSALGKTFRVTLWVDPAQHQIVRYSFDNLGFMFLPGSWLLRLEDFTASMSMRQPFPGVWLPARIDVRMALAEATGTYEFRLARTFANYRQAVTGGRLLAVPEPR